MILPGLIAVSAPVVIGFGIDKYALGGLLAGVTVWCAHGDLHVERGWCLGQRQKSFEDGGFKTSTGEILEKGTPPHDAAVVGDTAGRPLQGHGGAILEHPRQARERYRARDRASPVNRPMRSSRLH